MTRFDTAITIDILQNNITKQPLVQLTAPVCCLHHAEEYRAVLEKATQDWVVSIGGKVGETQKISYGNDNKQAS